MLNGIKRLLGTSANYQKVNELYMQKKLLLLDRPELSAYQDAPAKYEAVVFPLDCFIIFALRGASDTGSLCFKCLMARLRANPPYPLTPNTIGNLFRMSIGKNSCGYSEQPMFLNNLIVSLLKDSIGKFDKPTIISLNLATSDVHSVPLIPLHGCACRGEQSIAGPTRFVDKLLKEVGGYNETF